MLRIAFVLPAPVRVPMGGAAVVYRHAQGLAARGHHVEVIAPHGLGRGGFARSFAVAVRDRIQGVSGKPLYNVPGVETVEPRHPRSIRWNYDAVIATGVQTVPLVQHRAEAKGWWLVQGDETFVNPEARSAWQIGLRHIPCSAWLADAIRQEGGAVAGIVPNAVDPDHFGLDTEIVSRPPEVLALYHRHPVKGPQTLISTFEKLRTARPDVGLTVFCARTPSHRLPPGVNVVVRPTREQLRTLYNRAAVFLHTSTSEGWALTPMEAAVCGCAVVATDSRGPSEYLRAGRSMRLHRIGDAEGLAASVLDLLADAPARVAQATAGRADATAFSWEASTARLEQLLLAGREAT